MPAPRREADERESALGLLAHDRALVSGDEQREGDVLGHGLGGQELEVLEHDANEPAEIRDLRAAKARDVPAVHDDASGRGELLTDEEPDQGGFARAGRADKECEVSLIDGEVDVLERRGPVRVTLADVFQSDQIRLFLFLSVRRAAGVRSSHRP